MKKLIWILCLTFPFLHPSLSSAEQLDSTAVVKQCSSEAYLALRIATAYYMKRQSREAALDFAQVAGTPLALELVDDLVAKSADKSIASPAEFATTRIFRCLESGKVPMEAEISPSMSNLCFFQSEVIFYSFSSKKAGKSKDETFEQLEKIFSNRQVISSALLKGINDVTFQTDMTLEKESENQKSYYWMCLKSVSERKQ